METDTEWKRLCEQASQEDDPEKLLQIVQRINHILEEREKRLRDIQTRGPQA